jgi:hypothetical protein
MVGSTFLWSDQLLYGRISSPMVRSALLWSDHLSMVGSTFLWSDELIQWSDQLTGEMSGGLSFSMAG